MKIRWHSMLSTNHSWSFVAQALARVMKRNHSVSLKSTNGLEFFPGDLKHLLLPGYHCHPSMPELAFIGQDGNEVILDCQKLPEDIPDKNRPYDLELAYTILYQIPRRFYPESLCKMVIWNFESSIMPPGWQMYHHGIDYILPSSQYSYDIFLKNGIPAEKMVIVPHGVDKEIFNPNIPPFKLHTQKKVKFLHNAIPHHRKLHERVLEAYLDAFTGDDDVCLVMKTKFLQPAHDKPFEVDVRAILESKLKGRSNPPEIEVVTSFIPDIGSLYTACDAVVSMSACEGYYLPAEESLACGCINICPRHGGQLDFLNDENSLLIDTGEMKAPLSMQYWTDSPNAVVGDPSTKHCSELMRRVYENPEKEKMRISKAAKEAVDKFSWEAAADQIINLAQEHNLSKRIKKDPLKRSVLYIIPYDMAGGGEVWIREAIMRLDRSKYIPSIVFPLGASPELFSLFGDLDVKTTDLKNEGSGQALKCFIEATKPDIIHFYNSLQVYSLLLKTLQEGGWKGRIVETVHSELMWPDSMMKIAIRRGVSVIIGVSETICSRLAKMGNKNVVHVPQQVSWDRFKLPKNKNILAELGYPTDRLTIGTIARLSPEKNIPMVLSCAKAFPDILFIIVGDGPQRNILSQMASGLENVKFVGQRKDTENFYAAFDVFLLTSLMEGLPLTILESMASGTPVIAPDVGAIKEVVSDGTNGILVKNKEYINAITKIKNVSIRNDMAENAKTFSEIMSLQSNKNINMVYGLLTGGN